MPIPPPHGTYIVPALGIGNSESELQAPLVVGDNLDTTVEWALQDPADCNAVVSADFTNYTPVAEVLDTNGVVLETATVTPSPGDTTGLFRVELTPSQTTTALSVAAKTWRFRITAFEFQRTLFVGPFDLSLS